MSPVILLSISAVFHAAWNSVLKKSRDKDITLFATIVLSTILSLAIAPFLNEVGETNLQNLKYAIGAGLCEGFYFICLAKALERAPLGRAYIIMRGGAMSFVWLFSILFLHERIELIGVLGVTCVFAGLLLTQSLARTNETSEYRWAYLSALFIGGYHLLYGEALNLGIRPSYTFIIALGVSLPIMIYNCRKGFFERLQFVKREQITIVFAAGLACSLSFLIFLHGLKNSSPGMAITVRNSSIAYSQIFAFFLGEKLSAKQWLGASIVFGGCVLLGL